MELATSLSLLACLVMAATVIYSGRFAFLGRSPRNHWLSLASGVTVAYVFLGLMPKLVHNEEEVKESTHVFLPFLEDNVLFVAMLGMLLFYGLVLGRHEARERDRDMPQSGPSRSTTALLWVSVVIYTTYMLLIGYLVESAGEDDLPRMAVLAVVLAVHFLSTDFELGSSRTDGPARLGRITMAAGLLAGWGLGVMGELSKGTVAVSAAFLAGAILLTALNDELPRDSEARFLPFAVGCVVAGVLLATIG